MPGHVEESRVTSKTNSADLQDRLGSNFNNIKGYLEREIEWISLANMGISTRPLRKLIHIDTTVES